MVWGLPFLLRRRLMCILSGHSSCCALFLLRCWFIGYEFKVNGTPTGVVVECIPPLVWTLWLLCMVSTIRAPIKGMTSRLNVQ
jgi:hypothetical protein